MASLGGTFRALRLGLLLHLLLLLIELLDALQALLGRHPGRRRRVDAYMVMRPLRSMRRRIAEYADIPCVVRLADDDPRQRAAHHRIGFDRGQTGGGDIAGLGFAPASVGSLIALWNSSNDR